MKLQTDFPEDVNKDLKLAKAIYGCSTLQEVLIMFCKSNLKVFIEKGRKK